jgi:hypothetical protein
MASDLGMAWSTGVAAFVFTVPLWRFSQHAITVVHEGGHALFGLLFGGKVSRIELNADGGGGTMVAIKGAGRILTLLAGYLGPSLVGFSGAQMLVHGFEPRSVLLLSLVFSAFVLVLTRNLFGLLVAAGTVGLLWVVAIRSPQPVQLGFAYVWVWFLLMGSTRKIPDLYWSMLTKTGTSDAERLETHTHIGDVVWLFIFWLGSVAALIYGGALMVRNTA